MPGKADKFSFITLRTYRYTYIHDFWKFFANGAIFYTTLHFCRNYRDFVFVTFHFNTGWQLYTSGIALCRICRDWSRRFGRRKNRSMKISPSNASNFQRKSLVRKRCVSKGTLFAVYMFSLQPPSSFFLFLPFLIFLPLFLFKIHNKSRYVRETFREIKMRSLIYHLYTTLGGQSNFRLQRRSFSSILFKNKQKDMPTRNAVLYYAKIMFINGKKIKLQNQIV